MSTASFIQYYEGICTIIPLRISCTLLRILPILLHLSCKNIVISTLNPFSCSRFLLIRDYTLYLYELKLNINLDGLRKPRHYLSPLDCVLKKRIHVGVREHTPVCVHARLFVCARTPVCVCVCVCVFMHESVLDGRAHACKNVCKHVCVFVCIIISKFTWLQWCDGISFEKVIINIWL